jgi:hypothetical protein
VAMSSGISATHEVQLVAQKLIKLTLPVSSELVMREPSSSVKVDAGALSAVQPAMPSKQADISRAINESLFISAL